MRRKIARTRTKTKTKTFKKKDAYKSLNIVNSWINNIDSKASFALAAAGVLFGFLIDNELYAEVQAAIKASEQLNISVGNLILCIIITMLYLTTLFSIFYFILTIKVKMKKPEENRLITWIKKLTKKLTKKLMKNLIIKRIKNLIKKLMKNQTKKDDKEADELASFFFFGSIADMEETDYKNNIKGMSNTDILDDLIGQIYTNSVICTEKAMWYNRGRMLLLFSVGLLLIYITVNLFIGG